MEDEQRDSEQQEEDDEVLRSLPDPGNRWLSARARRYGHRRLLNKIAGRLRFQANLAESRFVLFYVLSENIEKRFGLLGA